MSAKLNSLIVYFFAIFCYFWQKRLLEIELSSGNTAEMINLANELLEWVNDTLVIPILNEKPPGEFEQLLQNKNDLQVNYYSHIGSLI